MRSIYFFLFILLAVASYADELDQARHAINEMEYEQAIVLLQKHLARHGDDEASRYLLARTYSWDNQFDAAVREFSHLLKDKPDNPDYLYGKAQALIWQDKNAEALTLLERAWHLANDNAEIWKTYILLLRQSKDPQLRQRGKALVAQAKVKFPNGEWDLIGN